MIPPPTLGSGISDMLEFYEFENFSRMFRLCGFRIFQQREAEMTNFFLVKIAHDFGVMPPVKKSGNPFLKDFF